MTDQKQTKLRVFLSWSGDQSRAVAQEFREWLPSVLQNVQPYFTPEDIDKGARWAGEIRAELEASDFGVIFLTPDNLTSPWILFEAGALSKLEKGKVAPLLLGMEPAEVSGPLSQLQLTRFNRDECMKLLASVNRALSELGLALEQRTLENVFARWWPDLEERVQTAMATAPTKKVARRSERDMLEEVLERLRAVEARTPRITHVTSPTWKLLSSISHGHATSGKAYDIPIEDLDFTVRTTESLKAIGVATLAELLTRSELDLLMTVGKTSVSEVSEVLGRLGLTLKK